MSLAEIATPRRDLVTPERQPRKATKMGTAIFDMTSKKCVAWTNHGVPDYDPQTHIAIESALPVNRKTKRWDDATGIRDATTQEMDDDDALEATSQYESDKMLQAIAIYVAPKLNPPVSAAQFKAGVIAALTTL